MTHVGEIALRQRRLVAKTPTLPQAATPPGTRGAILQAGLTLFAEQGFHGSSIRQLAAAVGITTATLYAHYPSKDDVLTELIRIGHEEIWQRLSAAVADVADPTARLRALVGAHVHLHIDHALLAVVVNNELHALHPDQAESALTLRNKCFQLLADTISDGVANRDFDIVDPELAAIAIASMNMRVANWYDPRLSYTPDQLATRYAEYALDIVRARRPI
ncbi:TetR/AcrR family transcriptional regulator [Nocardia sp. NPDC050378]|uniref:TetR/AcrR family transcriptional regulator n=1 Tax=Nocardia sp. NPDC050378 TaxID=3155400 RepID=UPI0033E65801